MKELKTTKTITEVSGYEAYDGTVFRTANECVLYEESAYSVLRKRLSALAVSVDGSHHDTFSECEIYTDFGCGSDEYEFMVVDIKNADDLKTVNQYYEYMRKASNVKRELLPNDLIPDRYIGKRVMITIGYNFDKSISPEPMTMDELVEKFRNQINNYFYPEK